MREINSVGNVGGQFADFDPNTNPQGTVVNARWANDVQDDLINIQDEAGIPEGSGAAATLLKAFIKLQKEMRNDPGDYIMSPDYKPLVAYDNTSVATAKLYHPRYCLNNINVSAVVDFANFPDWVPILRARKLRYLGGESGEVNSWTATVAGSVVTMPNNDSSNAILRALAEDALVHGGFTDFRTLTIAGTEYPIANVNTVTREITTTGTPASGSRTVEFFYHRIAGSGTTARVFKASGRSLITANDAEGRHIAGLRVRDRSQGHQHQKYGEIGSASGGSTWHTTSISASDNITTDLITSDGTNGTPRTGQTTHSPGLGVYLYEHVGRYLA
jgi:hypothetical protein